MIVTVSARCERLAALGLPRARCRPPGPRIRPREPRPGEPAWRTRPGEPAPGNPARRRLTPRVHCRPATGFSEPPLPVPVTVFRVGPAGPAGRADDAPAGP